jgi:hypothetical protein
MIATPDTDTDCNSHGNEPTSVAISEYELLRLANIRRNDEFLQSIGLSVPRIKTPAAATSTKKSFRKRKNNFIEHDPSVEEDSTKILPLRRSRRLCNEPGENELYLPEEKIKLIEPVYAIAKTGIVSDELDEDEVEVDISTERKSVTAAQIRDLIMNTCQDHSEVVTNEV